MMDVETPPPKRKKKNPKEAVEAAIRVHRWTAKTFPLTAVDECILETLAEVRFATDSVLAHAGAGSDAKHRALRLWALHKVGLIDTSGPIGRKDGGRLAAFYWLTNKGAWRTSMVVQRRVRAPHGAPSVKHHAHTEGVARVAVALKRIAAAYGGKVTRLMLASETKNESSFEKVTALRLRGQEIIPDALAVVTMPDGSVRPIVLEYENGANADDPRHFLDKLKPFDEFLRHEVIERALECGDEPPRLLVVCSTPELLRKVLERTAGLPADDWLAFYMQAMDALEAEPGASWYRIGAEPSPLFPTL